MLNGPTRTRLMGWVSPFKHYESLPDEDVPKDNVKIYSNPLFEFDDEYISSEVNPLFNEELEDIESNESCFSNLDDLDLSVTPLSDTNEDECFDLGGDIDEINAFLDMDISMDIEDGYYDLEGDIVYLGSLLINDTIPNFPPRIARILKAFVLVVLSIVHSLFNPSHAYIGNPIS
ncbi:hypothetical protein Tco_0031685 [Tanacetum coccineum]